MKRDVVQACIDFGNFKDMKDVCQYFSKSQIDEIWNSNLIHKISYMDSSNTTLCSLMRQILTLHHYPEMLKTYMEKAIYDGCFSSLVYEIFKNRNFDKSFWHLFVKGCQTVSSHELDFVSNAVLPIIFRENKLAFYEFLKVLSKKAKKGLFHMHQIYSIASALLCLISFEEIEIFFLKNLDSNFKNMSPSEKEDFCNKIRINRVLKEQDLRKTEQLIRYQKDSILTYLESKI